MDPELKAYLDALRQELSEQIAESRQHAERLNDETRQDLMAHAERLNQETRQDLMAHAERLNQETRQDLMAHAERLNQETRQDLTQQIQETRVLIEDLRRDLKAVAEGVLTVNDKLDRVMADHEARIARLERRVP
jgi:protein-disulfide isomerase-like protein with CxxC motif